MNQSLLLLYFHLQQHVHSTSISFGIPPHRTCAAAASIHPDITSNTNAFRAIAPEAASAPRRRRHPHRHDPHEQPAPDKKKNILIPRRPKAEHDPHLVPLRRPPQRLHERHAHKVGRRVQELQPPASTAPEILSTAPVVTGPGLPERVEAHFEEQDVGWVRPEALVAHHIRFESRRGRVQRPRHAARRCRRGRGGRQEGLMLDPTPSPGCAGLLLERAEVRRQSLGDLRSDVLQAPFQRVGVAHLTASV